MSDLESRYYMAPAIKWQLKTIEELQKRIKKQYTEKSIGLGYIDMELDSIIHRAYELKYCIRCKNKEKCTGLCIDTVEGWGDLLVEDADRIMESWRYRYCD